MFAPTLHAVPRTGPTTFRGLRLRLKPAHSARGFVQGAWWPRSDRLHTELPLLLTALSSRMGTFDRVIYDENNWAPASLRMEFRGRSIILEGSGNTSTNTLSVIGEGFDTLVLLVVPPHTDPTHAHTAVMTASHPDDVSTPDELLGIRPRDAQDRELALLARTNGGSPKQEHFGTRDISHREYPVAAEVLEVRRAR